MRNYLYSFLLVLLILSNDIFVIAKNSITDTLKFSNNKDITQFTFTNDSSNVIWGHQLITSSKDMAKNMVIDKSDNIYICGTREEVIDSSQKVEKDVFIIKYDKDGNKQWQRQLGSPEEDKVSKIALDDGGNIYIFGQTNGKLGKNRKGKTDIFIAKYDKTGEQIWIWQIGTNKNDVCSGLDIDKLGNLYIVGFTEGDLAKTNMGKLDVIVIKYDKHGKMIWKDQFGTEEHDLASDIRVGQSNDIYICGGTVGNLSKPNNGKPDIFIAKYDTSGHSLWIRQFGTENIEGPVSMELDNLGNLFLGGITYGDFSGLQTGKGDAFIVKLANSGELIWKQQFGTNNWDQVWQIALFKDSSGDILVGGCQNAPACHGFCRRYTSNGTLVWIKEFKKQGRAGGTCGRAVAVDKTNNCYHVGLTGADLFGINNGTKNIFIVKFSIN